MLYLFIGTAAGFRASEAGNEVTTEFPKLIENRKLNIDFLSEAGEWYDSHHALRTNMIDADAKSLLLLGESANSKVVVGKDGWMYYADEEGDLYGTNTMSKRAVFDLCRSLKMAQNELEKNGTAFVFAVAPNKSEMVPQYLPANVSAAAETGGGSGNLYAVTKEAEEQGVNFLDLSASLKETAQENGLAVEELYLKTDSHWNGMGAKIAADAILLRLNDIASGDKNASSLPFSADTLISSENFSAWTKTASIDGDLEAMLLPVSGNAEADREAPDSEQPAFTVEGSIESYFDPRITTSGSGKSSLIVWRDSFCNSMLPWIAGAAGNVFFTRSVPYYLNLAVSSNADFAVAERAQRFLPEAAQEPAAFEAPEIKPSSQAYEIATESIGEDGFWSGNLLCQAEGNQIVLTGWINDGFTADHGGSVSTKDRILLKINDKIVETCPAVVTKEDGNKTDWGYIARISLNEFGTGEWPTDVEITVIAEPQTEKEEKTAAAYETNETTTETLAFSDGPKG